MKIFGQIKAQWQRRISSPQGRISYPDAIFSDFREGQVNMIEGNHEQQQSCHTSAGTKAVKIPAVQFPVFCTKYVRRIPRPYP